MKREIALERWVRFLTILLFAATIFSARAIAQPATPLISIISAPTFSQEDAKLVMVRCSALTSLLKVEFDKVQGDNAWNAISEHFISSVFALPEVKSSPTQFLELTKPHMEFYRAEMDRNYKQNGALILGIVKTDMDACVAFSWANGTVHWEAV